MGRSSSRTFALALLCAAACSKGTPKGPAAAGAIGLTLENAEPVTVEKVLTLPDPKAGGVGGDVLFLLDYSNSFRDDLKTFQTRASEIVRGLNASFRDVHVGLALFLDAPCHGFGADEPSYQLVLPLTGDTARFDAALAQVKVGGGGDRPEGQWEAVHQAITGEGRKIAAPCEQGTIPPTAPGWQSGRLPFLVLSTDAEFHDPADTKGKQTYPYPATLESVAAQANQRGVTIFVLDSGNADPRAKDLTDKTRGRVFPLKSDSAGVVEAISTAMVGSTERAEIALVPRGDSAGFVERIEPERHSGIHLGKQRTVGFKVTFRRAVQPGPSEQTFRFQLELKINQAPVQAEEVAIVIPAD